MFILDLKYDIAMLKQLRTFYTHTYNTYIHTILRQFAKDDASAN